MIEFRSISPAGSGVCYTVRSPDKELLIAVAQIVRDSEAQTGVPKYATGPNSAELMIVNDETMITSPRTPFRDGWYSFWFEI